MYFILLTCIYIVTSDYVSIVIPRFDGDEYLGINGYANPCENHISYHDDIYTQMYNRYGDELCNNGQNISILCNVATKIGYKSCSKHIYNNCSNDNSYANVSWVDKIKNLTKNNYTYCQNNKYRFVLTSPVAMVNKLNMVIDPKLDIYTFLGYAVFAGTFCGLFLSIIFFG